MRRFCDYRSYCIVGLIAATASHAGAQTLRCCRDGQCHDLTRSACLAAGGLPISSPGLSCGGITSCRFVRCCLPDAECLVTTLVQCYHTGLGGLYHSEDATCAPGACPMTGACCEFPEKNCRIASEEHCTTMIHGEYQGDGTACGGEICYRDEACCFEGTCEDLAPAHCKAAGKSPAGFGTNCASYYCPFPGDFDADGDQDLTDFATLRECFAGPDQGDEGCVEMDDDYDVDLHDVYLFQNAFSREGPP